MSHNRRNQHRRWLPWVALLALVVAVGWISPPEKLSARANAAVRIAVCMALLALTVAPAARDFAASQAEDASNPYLNYSQ